MISIIDECAIKTERNIRGNTISDYDFAAKKTGILKEDYLMLLEFFAMVYMDNSAGHKNTQKILNNLNHFCNNVLYSYGVCKDTEDEYDKKSLIDLKKSIVTTVKNTLNIVNADYSAYDDINKVLELFK